MTREEAKRSMFFAQREVFPDSYIYKAYDVAIKALGEPERKTGKWVLDEDRSKEHVENIYICSACHNNEAWGETERTRYCSYCGAEMENWT